MFFVYGTALLVAAILLLGIAKYAVTRLEHSSWVRMFAATETAALLITTMSAFGLACLAAGLGSGDGLAGLGASVGIVLLTIIVVIRLSRTSKPAAATRVTEKKPAAPATI